MQKHCGLTRHQSNWYCKVWSLIHSKYVLSAVGVSKESISKFF